VVVTILTLALGTVIVLGGMRATSGESTKPASSVVVPASKTRVGINLFGLATFNRHQIFTNLIAQSEWFSSEGDGWAAFPADQLDALGWVRFLKAGQTAPRPLVLPPAPFRTAHVRCIWNGRGDIDVGGAMQLGARTEHGLTADLVVTGAEGEGAWIELTRTDRLDPVRDIDCREVDRPAGERFHPQFLNFARQFRIVRFLDWQRVNENADVDWTRRTLPQSSSQATLAGVSVEDMVDFANQARSDPWFLMPYRADASYIEAFARLVHARIDPDRTVYVELGNEVWNELFDAAQQAQREGVALGLGSGDPGEAQGRRYAQKVKDAMRIWTRVFADRPGRLVRVAAAHNANLQVAEVILGHEDTSRWVDALATAPYVWADLDPYTLADRDRIFALMPQAVETTIADAARHRDLAAGYGKRYIAYEGGQHLVTKRLDLALALQRDARMGDLYRRYLKRWDEEIHSDLVLYASIAPIAEYGAWGLQEYGGQPLTETPKLQAVQRFMRSQP
jgi:hypothetical protein